MLSGYFNAPSQFLVEFVSSCLSKLAVEVVFPFRAVTVRSGMTALAEGDQINRVTVFLTVVNVVSRENLAKFLFCFSTNLACELVTPPDQ